MAEPNLKEEEHVFQTPYTNMLKCTDKDRSYMDNTPKSAGESVMKEQLLW